MTCSFLTSCRNQFNHDGKSDVNSHDDADNSNSSQKYDTGNKEPGLTYEGVYVTIAKFTKDVEVEDNLKSHTLASNKDGSHEITLSGLTQGKMVSVEVKFVASNKTDSELPFAPSIKISDSKGYKLEKFAEEADIETKNEGTVDESIEVTGKSKTLKSGELKKEISYIFTYQCNKKKDLYSFTQDWTFYNNENDKEIDTLYMKLCFPSNYEEMEKPTYLYHDNSIELINIDPKAIYLNYIFEDGSLKDIDKTADGKYEIPINSSGTYEYKLRASELTIKDCSDKFNAIVLDKPSNLKFDNDKNLTFDEVEMADKYYIELLDSANLIRTSFSVVENSASLKNRIKDFSKGQYYARVYSNSTEDLIFKSVQYGNIEFSILGEPSIELKNKKISWSSVDGAEKYLIYRNNEFFAETSETSYQSRDFEKGDTLYVISSSTKNNVFDSKKSNSVTVSVA